MDIPWKSLSQSYVFGLSKTDHLCRNAQSCIRTSSPALRQWCGESSPHLFGNPASMVWPPHTSSTWPCWAHNEIPLYCMEYNRPMTVAPTNEESSWAQWGKNLIGKNNLSIESSEVNVWLVWMITTKHKSLKRVESCQKKHFDILLFAMLTRSFRIDLQMVFTLRIYISFWFVLQCTLDCSFVFEWI